MVKIQICDLCYVLSLCSSLPYKPSVLLYFQIFFLLFEWSVTDATCKKMHTVQNTINDKATTNLGPFYDCRDKWRYLRFFWNWILLHVYCCCYEQFLNCQMIKVALGHQIAFRFKWQYSIIWLTFLRAKYKW